MSKMGEQKLYITAHSSLIPVLRTENACLYEFLRNIALDSIDSLGTDPASWIAENANLVSDWTACLSDS